MSGLLMGFAFYVAIPMPVKMTLLALCDHATDTGERVHPSNKLLMVKTGLKERALRYSLRTLEEAEWIRRVAAMNSEGQRLEPDKGGRGYVSEYRINVRALELAYKKGAQHAPYYTKGASGDIERGQAETRKGAYRSSTLELQPSVETTVREEPPTPLALVASEAPSTNGHKPWPSAEALAELFNVKAPEHLSRVTQVRGQRREKAQRLLRTFPEREWWGEVLAQYQASRFLMGQTEPRPGHGSFKPDFDWLLSNGKDGIENAQKVHDGRYADDRERAPERRSGPDL